MGLGAAIWIPDDDADAVKGRPEGTFREVEEGDFWSWVQRAANVGISGVDLIGTP
jgi:hypothetical protein